MYTNLIVICLPGHTKLTSSNSSRGICLTGQISEKILNFMGYASIVEFIYSDENNYTTYPKLRQIVYLMDV